MTQIELTIDGERFVKTVEPRLNLSDFLRHHVHKTGVHVGCEHGVCGACTIILDGEAVRSCLTLAVQVDGCNITTIHGVAKADGTYHPVQAAMQDNYGLQCGFCTPGVVCTLVSLLDKDPAVSEQTLHDALSGHLCRCTGYQGMKRAVRTLSTADERSGE